MGGDESREAGPDDDGIGIHGAYYPFFAADGCCGRELRSASAAAW